MTSSGALEIKRNKFDTSFYRRAFHPRRSFGKDGHHCFWGFGGSRRAELWPTAWSSHWSGQGLFASASGKFMTAFGESSFLEKGFLSRAVLGFTTRCLPPSWPPFLLQPCWNIIEGKIQSDSFKQSSCVHLMGSWYVFQTWFSIASTSGRLKKKDKQLPDSILRRRFGNLPIAPRSENISGPH